MHKDLNAIMIVFPLSASGGLDPEPIGSPLQELLFIHRYTENEKPPGTRAVVYSNELSVNDIKFIDNMQGKLKRETIGCCSRLCIRIPYIENPDSGIESWIFDSSKNDNQIVKTKSK